MRLSRSEYVKILSTPQTAKTRANPAHSLGVSATLQPLYCYKTSKALAVRGLFLWAALTPLVGII